MPKLKEMPMIIRLSQPSGTQPAFFHAGLSAGGL